MRPCIFDGCMSTDRHWHGGFPGGYDNPDDPTGPPIPFTSEPEPGVRDYNGALLGTCQHPEELRRPIPNYHSTDPNEWECVGCGTWRMKDPALP